MTFWVKLGNLLPWQKPSHVDFSWLESKASPGSSFQTASELTVASRKIGDFIPCRLAMDESSSQATVALKCQTCGHWTSEGCPGGGKYVSGPNGALSDSRSEAPSERDELLLLRDRVKADGITRHEAVALIDRFLAHKATADALVSVAKT